MTTSKALVVLAAAALVTAGCGGSEDESTPAGPSESTVNPSEMTDEQAPPDRLVIKVSIAADQVNPVNEQLRAAVNEQIVIQVSSDVEDELHVHSTPEHTFKIEPKPAQSFQFAVDVPGRVDVELHKLNKTIATIAVQ